jgi:hypothetical protein
VVKRPNAAKQKITTCKPTACFAECMACLTCDNPPWCQEWFEVVLCLRVWSIFLQEHSCGRRTAYHPTEQPTRLAETKTPCACGAVRGRKRRSFRQ